MPVDPDTQAFLDLLRQLGAPEFSTLTPEQARKLSLGPPPAVPTAVHGVENRSIAGSEADIPIRIYKALSERANRGALVYFHGGGCVIVSLDSHDETAQRLCAGSGCTVISVDYRLAPETRYPGAMIDCFDATCWVAREAATLGIDATRIAVGGDSAGGNLAAAVALKARDDGGPALAFQLLIYPVTEPNFETRSYQDNATGYLLTRSAMQWFWDHYVPGAETHNPAYASPLRATNLRDLPPALVITAEFDPLRDEGEEYAARLASLGVPTSTVRFNGQIHAFFGMSEVLDDAAAAIALSASYVRKYLGT